MNYFTDFNTRLFKQIKEDNEAIGELCKKLMNEIKDLQGQRSVEKLESEMAKLKPKMAKLDAAFASILKQCEFSDDL